MTKIEKAMLALGIAVTLLAGATIIYAVHTHRQITEMTMDIYSYILDTQSES